MKYAPAARHTVVSATCAKPRTKIDLRSTHSLDGCNSRPMTNIRSTMPNCAIFCVVSRLLISPRLAGPMMMPAVR